MTTRTAFQEIVLPPDIDTLRNTVCAVCFTPETLVRTRKGNVPIASVEVGDEVLSSDGTFHRVKEVVERDYDGLIHQFRTRSMPESVRVTPDHPILKIVSHHNVVRCLPGACDRCGQALYNHTLDWEPIKKTNEGDWVASSIFKNVQNISSIEVPSHLLGRRAHGPVRKGPEKFILTPEFLWMLGLYIAEGSAGTRKITFSLHSKEIEYQDRLRALFESFGFSVAIFLNKNGGNGCDVQVYSTVLAEWFPTLLGSSCELKAVPNSLMSLPLKKLDHIFEGIWDGDATKKTGLLKQTSRELAYQAAEWSLRHGHAPSFQKVGRADGKKDWYSVHPGHFDRKVRRGEWLYRGRIFSDVVENTESLYAGKVYNLVVEEDHTYTVGSTLLVHNCGFENVTSPRCPNCGSEIPPDEFTSPDTSIARDVQDLVRQHDAKEDGDKPRWGSPDSDGPPLPDLICPECGSEFSSAEELAESGDPHLVPAANQKSPQQEQAEQEMMEEAGGEGQPGVEIQSGPEDLQDQGLGNQVDDTEAEEEDAALEEDPEATEVAEQNTAVSDEEMAMDPQAESNIVNTGYAVGETCPVCEVGILEDFDAEAELGPNLNGAEDPGAEVVPDSEDVPSEDEASGQDFGGGFGSNEEEQDDPEDDQDPEDEDGDEDDDDEDAPPWVKKSNHTTANRQKGRNTSTMPGQTRRNTQGSSQGSKKPNPAQQQRSALITALNTQANLLKQYRQELSVLAVRNDTLEHQIACIADASGLSEPLARIGAAGIKRLSQLQNGKQAGVQAGMQRKANPANPADPVFEPAPQPGIANNWSAMQSGAMDDVTQLGASPLTDVSPDASISVNEPYGEVANVPVGMNRVDVTAPVAGTEVANPPNQTIVPVDVRVGDPDNPQSAFEWMAGPVGSQPVPEVGPSVGNPPAGNNPQGLGASASKRLLASIHLARLQLQAKIENGNDLEIGSKIASSSMSDSEISSNIATLNKVLQAGNQQAAQRTASMRPRMAARESLSMGSVRSEVSGASGTDLSDAVIFE